MTNEPTNTAINKYRLTFALSLILVFALLWPTGFSPVERDRLYIWNVGQGSWSTLITVNRCYHFDMGGEFFVRHSALAWCRSRQNILFLSHLDSDHISFIGRASRMFRELCFVGNLADFSIYTTTRLSSSKNKKSHTEYKKYLRELKKLNLVRILPSCFTNPSDPLRSMVLNLIPSIGGALEEYARTNLNTPNDRSQIYVLNNKWLFTGDSTKKAERLWVPRLNRSSPNKQKIKIEFLVVGHHGSRTSTSELLLQNLPHLKMAIVSARKKKYGHPHTEVIAAFRQNKTPLLLTEQWGHLIFEF